LVEARFVNQAPWLEWFVSIPERVLGWLKRGFLEKIKEQASGFNP